jgi:probable F420-dependent oxidoreductase
VSSQRGTPPGPATLTVSLPNFGSYPGEWRQLIDLARQAEDAGIDRVVIPDHVVMGRNTHEYAWGKFPVPPEAPWLEPLTVLTAMAAVTSTIRLATGILIAPLRPAAYLAKAVATLDVLSAGRVDLGVGTGWQREEYEAEGLDFDRRGQLLTDTVAACRALWQETPATFKSASFSFVDIFCEPKPVQNPLPVWFSGVLHQRNLDRVVRLGDGWIPIMGATLDDIRDGASRLRGEFPRRGRAPESLQVQAPATMGRGKDGTWDPVASMASVPTLVKAGVTDIHVALRPFCPTLQDAGDVLLSLAGAFQAVAG